MEREKIYDGNCFYEFLMIKYEVVDWYLKWVNKLEKIRIMECNYFFLLGVDDIYIDGKNMDN